MKYIIAILLAVGVGFYFYSKTNNPEISFEEGSDYIQAVGKDFQYVFTPYASWEAEATIMNVSHQNDGPFAVFCGSFGLVWGDTAIELASYANKNIHDYFDQLSYEAQNVIRNQGCAARYLNEHLISIVAVAQNIEVDRALRSTKQGDEVSLEGYKMSIESAQYKGNVITMNIPNVVCITRALINGKLYGE